MYAGILLIPVTLSVLLRVLMRLTVRVCPQCDAKVEVGRRWCQRCQYRFDISRW